jgi:hypothetical protein
MFDRIRRIASATAVERRRHPRVNVRLPGLLQDTSEPSRVFCIVENISMGGAKVAPESALAALSLDRQALRLSIPQFDFIMPVRLVWKTTTVDSA